MRKKLSHQYMWVISFIIKIKAKTEYNPVAIVAISVAVLSFSFISRSLF